MDASSPASASLRSATSCEIVALAASLGGLRTLETILAGLPAELPVPLVVVQHLSRTYPSYFAELLATKSPLSVRWLRHLEPLRPGVVYIAPPGQHATVDARGRGVLSTSLRVNFVRPAADVLFTSAAAEFGARAAAVVLTGRLFDGARGAVAVRKAGGVVIAQDPATCVAPGMPQAAIHAGAAHFVLPPNGIARAITALTMMPGVREMFGLARVA